MKTLSLPSSVTSLLTVVTFLAGACANRGMAPETSGSGGASGTGGTPDTGGTGGTPGTGGAGQGTGGQSTGGAGVPPADGGGDLAPRPDAPAADVRDAAAEHACAASTFPFENATTNARLGENQGAASSIADTTTNPYCGLRSLEITTAFSGTSGDSTRAEVLVDLSAAQQDPSRKTVTIHVSAVPTPPPTLYVALALVGAAGNIDLRPLIKPLSSDWTTQTFPVMPDPDGGALTIFSISIQIFDVTGYSGKIFVDGLDLR